MRGHHPPRRCSWCRQWFVPSRKDRKFCVPECKHYAAYRRWKLKEAMKP